MTRRSGFTLLEAIVGLGLLGLLLASAATGLGGSRARLESRGLGDTVAQVFREARQQAMRDGVPVAVVLETSGGSRPVALVLTLRKGAPSAQTAPAVIRSHDFRKEFPGSGIFAGTWALDAARTRGATQASTTPPDTGFSSERLDVASWSNLLEPVFAYMPSGALLTNAQPHFDGEYHLVVGEGLEVSPGRPARLDKARSAFTVSLSPLGPVTVTPGVTGAPPSLLDPAARGTGGTPAAPQPVVGTANSVPVLVGTSVLPKANANALPAGVHGVVPAGEGRTRVLLQVKARDPDGDPLVCRWTATGGTFSGTSGEVPMEWSPTEGAYVAWQDYRPPLDALAGARFQLRCEVRDGRGGVASSTTPIVLMAADLETIAFTTTAPDGVRAVHVTNQFGTGIRRLLGPGDSRTCNDAWLSSDGSRLLVSVQEGPSWNTYVVNSDGTGLRRAPGLADGEGLARWSGDGARIAFRGLGVGGPVNMCNADGTGLGRVVWPGMAGLERVVWMEGFTISPDSASVAVSAYVGDRTKWDNAETPTEIFVVPVHFSGGAWGPSGAGKSILKPEGFPFPDWCGTLRIADLVWSPDGQYIAFDRDLCTNWETMWVRPDGTGVRNVSNRTGGVSSHDFGAVWAPSSKELLLTSWRVAGDEMVFVDADTGAMRTFLDFGDVERRLTWSRGWKW